MAKKKISVMVASTIYPNRDFIIQVCAMIQGYGYQVINSEYGTLYPPIGKTNMDACLDAVNECDIFFGIIQPMYSTGIVHQEFLKACELNKPRRYLAHSYVVFSRQLLKQFMCIDDDFSKRTKFTIKKTPVMDDIQVIDMYNLAVQNELLYEDRKYHWVQEYFRPDDAFRHVETLFANKKRVEADLKNLNYSK
jgi:hypothetical protein